MDQTRKIYQRAVCMPLENLETLWQSYNQFEIDLNKSTARKFVAEKSPVYMQARSALRQMRTIMGGLDRNKVPRPPTWTPLERQELDRWKAWIEWEKSNPLILDNENVVYSRVIYAYKQAMMNMRFYPELWYSAAEYAKSKGRESEALEFMKNGIKANKLSFLLHYQFVENEEANHRITEVRSTLESLINNVSQEYEKMNKMAEFMKLQLAAEEEADTKQLADAAEAERIAIVERQRRRKTQREMIDQEHEIRVEKIAEEATNAWIALMHAIRRAEGIKSARQVFAKARKAKPLSHHIFVASGISSEM
jgi:cleavage stimulation factor subunit 3